MNRLSTCAWIDTSRAATDSSQTRNSGLTASARAMPIARPLPTGELMREPAHQRRVESDAVQLQADVFDLRLCADEAVRDGRLADDIDDPHPRVERCVGILKDHLHPELLRSRLVRSEPGKRRAPPVAFAFGERQQSHREAPQRRFAAAGLADETHDLAGVDCEVDVVDGADDLLPDAGAKEVADLRGRVERLDEAFRDARKLDQRSRLATWRGFAHVRRHDPTPAVASARRASHIPRSAVSKSRAKPAASVRGEPCIRCRNSARNCPSRSPSAARAQAIST